MVNGPDPPFFSSASDFPRAGLFTEVPRKANSPNFADAEECVAGILSLPNAGRETESEEVGR